MRQPLIQSLRNLVRSQGALPAAEAAPPGRSLPGLRAVVRKEIADHVNSWRFTILALLVTVTGLASLYVAAMTIRQAVGQGANPDFVFLRLFTASDGRLPPFTAFIGFLAPLVGLALGFDAICGEQSHRTLSRLLAQPIHRDAVINGKFLAGVFTIAGMLLALFLVVGSLGLMLIGVPPSLDEMLRLLTFFLVTVAYVAFWLALSILFSVVFRQAATSALAGIAVWLFFVVFGEILSNLVADAILPVTDTADILRVLRNAQLKLFLNRLSPVTLYNEAMVTLLSPEVRALGPVLVEQLLGSDLNSTLPFGQSLLLIWPHVVGMICACMICFAISYVLFMRREIRA